MIRIDCEGGAMHVVELSLEHEERRPQIDADALPSGDAGGRTMDPSDPRSAEDENVYII